MNFNIEEKVVPDIKYNIYDCDTKIYNTIWYT